MRSSKAALFLRAQRGADPLVAELPAGPSDVQLAGARAASITLPVFTSATKPAASAFNAGLAIRVRDAGATTVQVCCQNSVGGYEWVTCGTST